MTKRGNEEVKAIIEDEGLGYAVQSYMDEDSREIAGRRTQSMRRGSRVEAGAQLFLNMLLDQESEMLGAMVLYLWRERGLVRIGSSFRYRVEEEAGVTERRFVKALFKTAIEDTKRRIEEREG